MDEVKEQSSATVILKFYDDQIPPQPVTPDDCYYRLDDVESGTEITEPTLFNPGDFTHEIEITAAENTILNEDKEREVHRMTVSFEYGTNKQGTGEYDFAIVNLKFFPMA